MLSNKTDHTCRNSHYRPHRLRSGFPNTAGKRPSLPEQSLSPSSAQKWFSEHRREEIVEEKARLMGCPIGENVGGVDYHQYLGLFDALGQLNAWGHYNPRDVAQFGHLMGDP